MLFASRPTLHFVTCGGVLIALGLAACVGEGPVTSDPTSSSGGSSSSGSPGTSGGSSSGDLDAAVPTDAQATDGAAKDHVIQVAAGSRHSCALYSSGAVYCWGDNSSGQLGSGQGGTDHVPPTRVPLERPVTRIALGVTTSCAIENDNTMWCWGENDSGELGVAPAASQTCGSVRCAVLPQKVDGFLVKDIVLGQRFACALPLQGGGVICWGANATSQAALPPATTTVDPPHLVAGLTTAVTKVGVGYGGHTVCALDTTGSVWCWGSNSEGQLGHAPSTGGDVTAGTFVVNPTPQKITFASGAKAVDVVAAAAICAVLEDGTVDCWGRNQGNELQLKAGPDSTEHHVPVPIEGVVGAQSIVGGFGFCTLAGSSQPTCWGPTGLAVGSATFPQTCAVYNDGAAVCHGVGTVTGPSFSSLSMNVSHVVGIGADGTVLAWGDDQFGRVNVAREADASGIVTVPAPVLGLP